MGTTWQYGPKQFDAEAGKDVVVRLDVPHRGQIRSIQLVDSNGAAEGNFEIYDSQRVTVIFNPPEDDQGNPLPIAGFPAEIHTVTGELPIVAGKYSETKLEFDYVNSDGTPTNNIRRLWMRINTDSAGPFILKMVIAPVDLSS